MKYFARSLMIACLFVWAAGCVSTLNPLYTERDLIFDPAIMGTWTDEDSKETWAFSYSNEKEYRLVYTDEEGRQGEFKARLLRFEGNTFLDISPVRPPLSQNDFYKSHFLALHTFVKVNQSRPAVQISYLEPEFLKKTLAKDSSALRHEKLGGEILITASTEELQAFLLEHLNTEGAFAEPINMKRK